MSLTASSSRNKSDRLPLKKRCSPSIVNTSEESNKKRSIRKVKSSKRRAKSMSLKMNHKHGRWTADERRSFLFGLKLHGKGKWSLIAKGIPTRSTVQVKTHAQIILKRIENGEDVFDALEIDEKYTNAKTEDCKNPLTTGFRPVPTTNHDDLEDVANVLSDNTDNEESCNYSYNDALNDESDNDILSSLDTDMIANHSTSYNDPGRQEERLDFLADYDTALQSASSGGIASSTMPNLAASSAYKITPRLHFDNNFRPQPCSFASLANPHVPVPLPYSPYPPHSHGRNEYGTGHHNCTTPASYHSFQAAKSSPFQPWGTHSTNAATPPTPSTNGNIFSQSPSPSPTAVNYCYTHFDTNIATVTNNTHTIGDNDTKRNNDILSKEFGSKCNNFSRPSLFEKNDHYHDHYDGDDIDDESSEIAHILLGMSSPQPPQKTVFEV